MALRSRPGARALAAVTLAMTLTAPFVARADGPRAAPIPAPVEQYKQDLRDEVSAYFGREKVAARLFLAAGLASVAAGGVLISRPDTFARSAGYTLAGFGVIQAVAATAYHFSIDSRIEKLHGRIMADPTGLHHEELDRIEQVSGRFVIFRYTEIALMAAGIGVAAAGEVTSRPLMKGIGLGVAVEAFVLLALDQYAEHSAHTYQEALRRVPVRGAFVAPVLSPRTESVSGFVFGLNGTL